MRGFTLETLTWGCNPLRYTQNSKPLLKTAISHCAAYLINTKSTLESTLGQKHGLHQVCTVYTRVLGYYLNLFVCLRYVRTMGRSVLAMAMLLLTCKIACNVVGLLKTSIHMCVSDSKKC